MPKITLEITGLPEIWVGITGLKNPSWDPQRPASFISHEEM